LWEESGIGVMLMEEKPNKKKQKFKATGQEPSSVVVNAGGRVCGTRRTGRRTWVLLMAGASGINVLFFKLLSQTRSRQTFRQTAVTAGGCSFFSSQGLSV
jgi:hypothetical protein